MKRLTLLLLAILAMLTLGDNAAAQRGPMALQWLGSMEEANTQRARTGRPMMLYFFNNVARPSYEMRVETLSDTRVQEQLGEFILVAINQQSQPRLAERFNLLKVPTTIFLDNEGREIDRLVGMKTVGEFLPYVERVRGFLGDGGTSATAGDAFAEQAVDLLNAAPNSTKVTFTHYDPRAREVSIIGDFNDWRLESLNMTRNSQGFWTIDLYLREGVFEYLFYADGHDYRPDLTNPFRKINPYGKFNSIVIIGNPKMSPIIQGRSVTFLVYNTEASRIAVAGTFNNWEQLTMYRNPNDPGMWGVRYELPPGMYHYKYIVDGEWQVDPENYSPVDDRNGNFNSSFVIR